ncbi:hypothetical protein AB1Y20_012707 [Prymnesium parvum]|uniref:Uncharacterized protein n=1 Tax=Prymnesium parvum TaxID=97485 RepID=A0AB34ILC9_PRYPA
MTPLITARTPLMPRASLLLLAAALQHAAACSAFLAARRATADGSTLSLHTDDCSNCDFRLARAVPAQNSPQRVVAFREAYPREVSSRTSTYLASNLDAHLPANMTTAWASTAWYDNQTLGFIGPLDDDLNSALGIDLPEGKLLGAVEGLYSILNTKQVSIAESTCTAKSVLFNPMRPATVGGRPASTNLDGALWDVSALTKAALARCSTARCAVDLMGYLAVEDGFYGQHGLPSEVSANGEALLVADPLEAWVFHVAPVPPTVGAAAGVGEPGAHSAVWVAQRVPSDHFVFIANRFIVRDVIEVPPDAATPTTRACRGEAFRHSSNLFPLAEYLTKLDPDPQPLEGAATSRAGVWRRADGLRVTDFLVTFGGDTAELAPYSNDRIWRVLSLFAGDTKWVWPPPTPLATGVYPFSVKPSKPVEREAVIALGRDLYRGAEHTQLDLTKGLAAGPWGDPSRYDVRPPVTEPPVAGGSFPRAISMFRTSYSHIVAVGRPAADNDATNGLAAACMWVTQGAPHAGIYTPLHVLPAMVDLATDGATAFPPSLSNGSLHRVDIFDPAPEYASVFWRTTVVNNWARAVGYDFVWPILEAAQAEAEAAGLAIAEEAEALAAKATSVGEAASLLAVADQKAAARAAKAAHALIQTLMTKLHDGYHIDEPYGSLSIVIGRMFFPGWWLQQVGYYHPPFYGSISTTNLLTTSSISEHLPSAQSMWGSLLLSMLLFGGGLAVGAAFGRRLSHSNANRELAAEGDSEAYYAFQPSKAGIE